MKAHLRTLWTWLWPLLMVVALIWGTVVALSWGVGEEREPDLYAWVLLFTGAVLLAVLLVMLLYTRVWTSLALGMFTLKIGLVIWTVGTAVAVLGWIVIDPGQIARLNEIIVASLFWGALWMLLGTIGNVRAIGRPIARGSARQGEDRA